MVSNKPKVWVLVDNRAGNSKQAIALAEILEVSYKTKKIKYNIFAKLPNFLKFGFVGLTSSSKKILNGKPDIVISAGRRTASIATAIKKNTGAKVIQIMHPGLSIDKLDVLILPNHDKKPHEKYLPKTVFVHGALTHNDTNEIKSQVKIWSDTFKDYSRPLIGVLLGGKSKKTNFTKVNAKTLAKMLIGMVESSGGSLLITTSRRTPKKSIEELQQHLNNRPDIQHYLYNYHQAGSKNPYLALLGLADKIVVTGDSVSMCSEAIHTAKPVYVFAEENMIGKKHRKYIDYLFDTGLASPLFQSYKPFKPKKNIGNDVLKKKIWSILGDIKVA